MVQIDKCRVPLPFIIIHPKYHFVLKGLRAATLKLYHFKMFLHTEKLLRTQTAFCLYGLYLSKFNVSKIADVLILLINSFKK